MNEEKLRVFISSAMSPEGEIDWMGMRELIREKLESDGQFDVFAIEGSASPESSERRFLSKVDETDIFVCIIGSEIRGGTEKEFRQAQKRKKPTFLYCLDVDREDSAEKFLESVSREDYLTYCDKNSYESLPTKVLTDLKSYLTEEVRRRPANDNDSDGPIDGLSSSQAPYDALNLFGDTLDYLYGRIDIDDAPSVVKATNPYLQSLGHALVDWVIDGKPLSLEPYKSVLDLASSEYGLGHACSERRKATDLALKNDFDAALRIIDATLDSGANSAMELSAVLLDARSFAFSANENSMAFEYQSRIDQSSQAAVFPPGDYYLLRAKRELSSIEEFVTRTSTSLVRVNRRIFSVIDDLMSYLEVSVFIGSYVHLLNARNEFASVLSRLSRLYEIPTLGYWSLRIYMFAGESSKMRSSVQTEWELIENSVAERADSLWNTVELNGSPNTYSLAAEVLSPYVSDAVFERIAESMMRIDCSEWSENSLKALAAASMRMNSSMLVDRICSVVDSGVALNRDFWIAFSNVRTIKPASADFLSEAVMANSDKLLRAPQYLGCLASLAAEHSVLVPTAREIGVQLKGVNKFRFNFLLECGQDATALIRCLVKEGRNHLSSRHANGVVFGFADRPIRDIAELLGRDVAILQREDVLSECEGLVEMALGQEMDYELMDDVLVLLLAIAFFRKSHGEALSPTLVDAVRSINLDSPSPYCDASFVQNSRLSWYIRVCAVRCAYGVDEVELLAESFLLPKTDDYRARKTLADSLWLLLESIDNVDQCSKIFNILIYSIVTDSEWRIRAASANSAAILYKRTGDVDVLRALRMLFYDFNPNVRDAALRALIKSIDSSDSNRNELVKLLLDDCNWVIRNRAATAIGKSS